MLLWGKIILCTILIIRLYKLQIKQHHKYQKIAEKNSTTTLMEPAPRGKILDRNNEPLAINKNIYGIIANGSKQATESIAKLTTFLKLDLKKTQQIISNTPQNSSTLSIIMSNISWEQFCKVEINLHKLPGISTIINQIRFYPYQHQASHIIGYTVNRHNDIKITKQNIQSNTPVGKIGIEKYCDNILSGAPGFIEKRINAKGLSIDDIGWLAPKRGGSVKISIDIRAQQYALDILGDYTGCMMAIDLSDGAMLVSCNSPSFNPNHFTQQLTPENWKKIQKNKSSPLFNRFTANLIPPGSLFKIVTAIAAIHNKTINPMETIHCSGSMQVGNCTLHCWKKNGHGDVNLSNAIASSCNTYFYEIGKRINIDLLLDVAKLFGFGTLTNIESDNERSGFLPEKKWRQEHLKDKWFIGDTINSVIGQGYILATPLQLITMIARVATNQMITPTFLNFGEKKTFPSLPLTANELKHIYQGMYDSVYAKYGTSFLKQNTYHNFTIAGKTGSSQTVSKRNDTKNKTHAIFAGYAPFHTPKVAVLALIEKAGAGSKVAAPRAKLMLQYLHKLGYLK